MADLRTFVHVVDEAGLPHVYGPGDEIPADHAALITNPKAWAEEPESEDKPKPARKAAAK